MAGRSRFLRLLATFRALGNLQNLNLSNNSEIGNAFYVNLKDLFEALGNLQNLDFTGNAIDRFNDNYFEDFCNSLVYLSDLKTLNLDLNKLSEEQFNTLTTHLSQARILFRIVNKEDIRRISPQKQAQLNEIYRNNRSEFTAIVAQGLKLEGDQRPPLPPEVTELIFSEVFGRTRTPEIRTITAIANAIRDRHNNTPALPNQQQPDPNAPRP